MALLATGGGLLVSENSAWARVEFDREFAPSETWVKAPEKPFRDDICLNGSWQFQPVALPEHFQQGTDPAPELASPTADGWDKVPIRIPSPWNVNTFADRDGQAGDFRAYPSYPGNWAGVKMGWLRRTFTVPPEWKGRRILIHLTAAAGDLQFLVNGKDAGHRFDIFFPFDVDVTDLVQYGASNEILVGVRKPELFDENGRYGRRTYQAGSFWGQHVVGIWQDIDLVSVPVVRVSDVFVQSLVDQDTLKAEVTLHNDGAGDARVDVGGAAYPWVSLADKEGAGAAEPKWKLGPATAINLPSASVTIPAHGDKVVTLQQKVSSSLNAWTPDAPELYGLLVDVKSGGQSIDRKYTRFGWRQFSLSGSQVLLNGKPIVLKGDSWHFLGIPQMTRRYPWAWFTALHDAHLNAVRLHAEPYPEFYLDVADEMGIMVLDETAIWASDGGPKLDSDLFWKDTVGHIGELVRRDRSHPSVFGWSVCNEVKPVVQNVFHNPPGMMDKLLAYYPIWAQTVQSLDPTRPWISADGDDDAEGLLPTFVIHYGDAGTMEHASKSGKPWGVGEAGGAYYMTPKEVAKTYGEKAYDSFQSRMEGIAVESYKHLLNQRKYGASYRSVFNLVWYGLQPLPLGLADPTKPPTLDDGIFFPPLVEGKPGVQPERLGPYCTTLNPSYDPGLPLYKTWPLFDAIADAQAEPPIDFPLSNSPSSSEPDTSQAPDVKSVDILAGPDGKLRAELASLGVDFDSLKTPGTPDVLFVDGENPPEADAAHLINQVLAAGGAVMVWGVLPETLAKLNALLPAALEVTDRKSSSLSVDTPDPITAGLKNSDLYFSESTPPVILDGGLGGPLVEKSTVLLKAANTDWLKWNKEAEFAKTAMIVRSEREAKPSGAALIEIKQGAGRLFVCNLPAGSELFQAQKLDRNLLQNLGIPLQPPVDVGEPFLKTGHLVRVLACGRFSAEGDGADKAFVDPEKDDGMRDNDEVGDKRWGTSAAEKEIFDLRRSPLSGPGDDAVSYLSFWVLSPRALDDLLLEPNVPKLDLTLQTPDAIEVWLNGKSVLKNPGATTTAVLSAQGLPLRRGWNHFLIRLVHDKGDDTFQAKLICSQPDFLDDLKSALQKP
jgi:Glycosyl hydrolases family 2, TIM barrel domain/Glycosyl hydrolases family 2/Glycosyl hydrolases family 2, sugar binding domain